MRKYQGKSLIAAIILRLVRRVDALGTVVPKIREVHTQKTQWRNHFGKQAFLGATKHTELDLRGEQFLCSRLLP